MTPREKDLSRTEQTARASPPDSKISRQVFCTGLAAGLASVVLAPGCSTATTQPRSPQPSSRGGKSRLDLRQPPDLVRAFPEKKTITLPPAGSGTWGGDGITVRAKPMGDGVRYSVAAPMAPLMRLQLRWHGSFAPGLRVLNDHWERSYADLEWRGLNPNRTLPWYFLTYDGQHCHGYGVKVRPNAFCFWNIDEDGISLWLDVRNGGSPVLLKERELILCEVTSREGRDEETPFAVAREFCHQLCPNPRLPKRPILGTNDWYYSYGNSQPDEILRVTARIAALAPAAPHRMFSVIDGGWAPGGSDYAPWDRAKDRFGPMDQFAAKIRQAGAEPGIWFRPLATPPNVAPSLVLTRRPRFYDPSIPEVLAQVSADTRRFREWGYTMIKHDFSTFDVMGRWGFDMGATLTTDDWAFADRTRTTAEIILSLYQTLRDAAGNDALLIGCNTFSHLSAGLFELNRIGDDTSGKAWDRTRRMGVNTIAFRAAQHDTFYAADPDIAAITPEHPWTLGQHWLRLIAESGMPLFVSPDLNALGPAQTAAIKEAFVIACTQPTPRAEPLDWLETTCPRRWKVANNPKVYFPWMPTEGPWPFSD